MTTESNFTLNRVADEDIYLNEDRLKKPKESFKVLGNVIKNDFQTKGNFSVFDAGSATGDLAGYLQGLFPGAQVSGMDISEKMVETARTSLPSIDFFVGSLLEGGSWKSKGPFDAITCVGVLSIFDDPYLPIKNLSQVLKPGGFLYIGTPVNEDPIDLMTRYKTVLGDDQSWQSGWNIFSKVTLENIVQKCLPNSGCDWIDFEMPFPIERGPDPMRTWTTPVGKIRHQLINGACQLINMKFLRVKTSK